MTTAIYKNRIQDKKELENKIALKESGDDTTLFYLQSGCCPSIFAKGYERIVYGDHGPYVEFKQQHIQLPLLSKFKQGESVQDMLDVPRFYYIWMYPLEFENVKVYLQLKPVSDLPNAPKRDDGKKSDYNRPEGYADYKKGFFYVNPYSFSMIETPCKGYDSSCKYYWMEPTSCAKCTKLIK